MNPFTRRLPMGLFCALILAGTYTPASARQLTIGAYLDRVEEHNPEIRSADLARRALAAKVLEMDMAYSPYISGGYSYTDDRSGAGFGSTLPTSAMRAGAWSLNAAKKFRTGTTLSAGYSSSEAAFDLLSPTAITGTTPVSNFTGYELKPALRLEQSLLRDFRGGLTGSGIRKAQAATRAGMYGQMMRRYQMLLRARAAYWGLALAREVVSFRQTSLERTEKLLQWTQKRLALDLAEKSDLLQTEAAYQLRMLSLSSAQEDLTNACRAFNEMIGESCASAEDEIEKISDAAGRFAGVETLSRTGERPDVLAARALFESSELAETETYYRSLPELTLSGTYALHGLALNYGDAWKQVSGFDKPAYGIGLTFTVPLDYVTLRTVRGGYRSDFESSRETLRAAETAARNDWQQLERNWKNLKERLVLARRIHDLQEERLRNEESRFTRGRTTTYQLLTAENDLDDAALTVYRLAYEQILVHAQAELFAAQPLTIAGGK